MQLGDLNGKDIGRMIWKIILSHAKFIRYLYMNFEFKYKNMSYCVLFTSITVVKRKWFPLQETLGRKIQIWSSLYLTLIWSRVIPFINGVQSDIKNNVEAIYVVCMTKNKTYCFFEKYIKTREINLILIKLFYNQPLTINLIDISTISYLN